MRLPAGSVLQFQIHYSNSTRKVASDRTSIGFVFADTPPKREVVQYEIWNNMFAIPPRAANHRVTACFTLDQDVAQQRFLRDPDHAVAVRLWFASR